MKANRVDPILRWAGSKRRLVPALLAAAPDHYGRYYEPFAGSACFFLALAPTAATISDSNGALITTYRTISRHAGEVWKSLSTFTVTEDEYYRIRSLQPEDMPQVQQAARFIYLNRNCFNGIYRENRRGEFNVPFGTRVGQMPNKKHLEMVGRRMYRARLLHADFESSLAAAEPGDFAYLDPPYITTDRASYGEYGYGTYRDGEVDRLIRVLKSLDQKGVRVLVSYKDDPKLSEVFKFWSVRRLSVLRNVASKQNQRMRTGEILASNYSDLESVEFGAYSK